MGLRMHYLDILDIVKAEMPENAVCYVMGSLDCGFSYRSLSRKYPEKAGYIKGKANDLSARCDIKTALGALGYHDVRTIDMNGIADIRIDLTAKVDGLYREKADLVLDSGTLEHIFDTKAAVTSMNSLLRRGGIIFHMSPVSIYKHGFVNFNPSFFDSLYLQSGYRRVLRTMNVSVYNPFFVIDTSPFPEWLSTIFKVTNRIFVSAVLFRFNLPVSREKDNKTMVLFDFLVNQFGLPKGLIYCCAYQKTAEELKIPYDIWK